MAKSYGFKIKQENGFSEMVQFATSTDLIKNPEGSQDITLESRLQRMEQNGLERIVISDWWDLPTGHATGSTGAQYISKSGNLILVSNPADNTSAGYSAGQRLFIADTQYNDTSMNITEVNGVLNQFLHSNQYDLGTTINIRYSYTDGLEGSTADNFQIPSIGIKHLKQNATCSTMLVCADIAPIFWAGHSGAFRVDIIITRPV